MIFLKLFLTFFKIGLFTFGGGYAMLPFIQSEVLKNNWMAEQEIIDFINDILTICRYWFYQRYFNQNIRVCRGAPR